MTGQVTARRPRSGSEERGGILAWLLMSLLLVCVLVVGAGFYLVHTVKVHESRAGNDVQVDTPFGSVHVQQHPSSAVPPVGMPIYPGAKLVRDRESATVDLSSAVGDRDVHIVAGKWETPDPIDKVQKFYENKFPEMSVIQHDNHVEMHGTDTHGKRVIALKQRHGITEISLASVGEPRAN